MKRTKQQKLIYYEDPRFYEKTVSQLEEIEERVVWLMKWDDHNRNCDTCLIFSYWNRFSPVMTRILFSVESERHKLTAIESITRARRIIQNTLELWPPTDPDVIKKRRIREEAIKEWNRRH